MYPNLKLQMWRTGVRQNRLAQMLNMDETVLSRIVNGFRKPTSDLREQVAALLQCDAAWLFEEAVPPLSPSRADARKSLGNSSG